MSDTECMLDKEKGSLETEQVSMHCILVASKVMISEHNTAVEA